MTDKSNALMTRLATGSCRATSTGGGGISADIVPQMWINRCGGRNNQSSSGSAARAAITTASRLERLSLRLVDPDSFREQDTGLASTDPLHFVDETAYRERLLALKAETGEADALVSGFARLQGHEVAIAALDFGFLGGSMGVVVGEKLVRIAERARERRVP